MSNSSSPSYDEDKRVKPKQKEKKCCHSSECGDGSDLHRSSLILLFSLIYYPVLSGGSDMIRCSADGINSRINGKSTTIAQTRALAAAWPEVRRIKVTTADNANENVDWHRTVRRPSRPASRSDEGCTCARVRSIECPLHEIDLA